MIEPALSTATPAPEEDVTTTLYRAAIGPVNNQYYLPIFTRFEAADHAGISWNSAASLLTLNWLVFRKLWVAALAYVGIVVAVALLVFGIGHLVFQFSDTLMMALGLGFGLAAFVLPGLFGNALFHTECRKAMSQALVGHSNVADARDQLLRQASSRKRLLGLAVANAVFWVLAAIAYQQFSGLGNVAVMPHGALDAGNVAVGRADAAQVLLPSASASASASPSAPPSAPPAAPLTSAATAPASAPSSAPVSEPAGVAATTAASVASAPSSATASAPAAVRTAAASDALPAATGTAPAAPASAPAKAQAKPQAKPPAVPKTEPAASAPVAQVHAPKDPEKKKASKKLQAALAAEAASKPGSAPAADAPAKPFFINVGLFGVPENAAKAHAKLLEAGLPSVMKELKAKTLQIRVRVGPFATQAQADAAAEKIKSLQLDAVIIQL